MILEIAGGELAAGVIDVGQPHLPREPIVLRLSQIERILGIPVLDRRVRRNPDGVGLRSLSSRVFPPAAVRFDPQPTSITVVSPSWRRGFTREIDLIEEVGRINGYDAIPETLACRWFHRPAGVTTACSSGFAAC